MIGKKICLFLDGAWSAPSSRARNEQCALHHLYRAVSERDANGLPQLRYYDPHEVPRVQRIVPGQASGYVQGLESAYRFLMLHYRAGDRIFLFGRSRGALAVHALTALISHFGLLRNENRITINYLIERMLYGRRAPTIQQLTLAARIGRIPRRTRDCQLLVDSRRVPIHFIGVWDTVTALRISALEISGVPPTPIGFRCLRRSSLVEHGFQALAIDELRPLFRPALWCDYRREQSPQPVVSIDRFEQRWFPGTHDNLSGDLHRDPLAKRPAAWLQSKAVGCGLLFDAEIPAERHGAIGGTIDHPERLDLRTRLAALAQLPSGPRKIGRGPVPVDSGNATPLNETVDIGALVRWEDDSRYRPESLRRWKRRQQIDSFLPLDRTVYAEDAESVRMLMAA